MLKMKTIQQRKLTPGQPGTKKHDKQYGKSLVCVRYKYDINRKEKIKTIELIVESAPWEPGTRHIPKNKIMAVQIDINEMELHNKVKSLGGKWDHKNRVWKLSFESIKILNLENRIVNKNEDQ